MNEKFEHLLLRAEQLISRIESVLPQALSQPDWTASVAYRYRKRSSGHGVLELQLSIAAQGALPAPAPPFVGFFLERVLPDPATARITREIFLAEMREVVIADPWHGPATLSLHAPELVPLAPREILGGQVNTVSWIKGGARLVAHSSAAFPRPVWG